MQALAIRSAIPCGLILLFAGCTAYHPYGAGRYPGVYNMPPGSYQSVPNGTILPQNGSLGQPSPLNGADNSKLQAPGGAGLNNGPTTLRNNGVGSIEANRNNAKSFSGEKPVPNYNDPNKIGGSPKEPMTGAEPEKKKTEEPEGSGTPFSPFKNEGGAALQPESNSQSGTAGSFQLTQGSQENPEEKTTAPQFSAPRPLPENSSAQPLPKTGTGTAASAPSPYDHDKKKYTWLRGKIDYDEGSKTWQIIYSLDPADQYGGSLTLVDHPSFKKLNLKNDDVVLVEGQLDTIGLAGKPNYKINKLFGPLAPPGVVQAPMKEPAAAVSGN